MGISKQEIRRYGRKFNQHKLSVKLDINYVYVIELFNNEDYNKILKIYPKNFTSIHNINTK